MTWLRKMRPVLIGLGLALAIGSLIGARALTNGSTADASGKPPDGGSRAGGPVVLGLVDSDPPPVAYGLPPVLQSGTVSEVLVKDGTEITAEKIQRGENVLYKFDDTIQQADV